MAIGPDALAVRLGKRQVAGAGTGCDDDILGGEFLVALVGLHGHLAGRGDLAITHNHINLVLLHQAGNALVELLGNAARALDDGLEIGADLLSHQTIIGGMFHIMKHLGRTQHRLGRDASPVEANATKIFAFDNSGFQAQLRGAYGGDIAAGSGSENDEVICVGHDIPFGNSIRL